MKLKLIVSSLFALGVMSEYPLAFGAAKDLTSGHGAGRRRTFRRSAAISAIRIIRP